MDKEFLFLAVVCVATLVVSVFSFLPVFNGFGPDFSADEMELYWQGCDDDSVKGFEYQADCELRQVLLDANLMGGTNG